MMAKKSYPLLFLDLETTGHDPLKFVNNALVPWHEIIDIGAVLVDPVSLDAVAEFSEKVKPRHPERCADYAAKVNRYPDRAARGEWNKAIPLEVAIHWLLQFIRQHVPAPSVTVLAGENFFFDWGFLVAAFAMCGIFDREWEAYLHYKKIDVSSMAVEYFLKPGEPYDPNMFSMRSGELFKLLDLEPEPAVHEGINGARCAWKAYRRLIEMKAAKISRP